MKRLAVTFAAALFAWAASAAGATVSGVVRDGGSGGPLPAMVIEAYTTAGVRSGSATSNASGSYSLTLPAGSYRLLAYDPAGTYATSFHPAAESFDTSDVVTLATAQSASVSFALERAGWIAGVVTGDAAPLASAVVTVYNASGTTRGWTRTDAAGTYRLAVPAGSYRVAAWDDARAFVPTFNGGAGSFAAAVPLEVHVAVEVRASFDLPRASFVTGTVVDAITRQPLAAMVVDAWSADGRYVGWAQTTAAGVYRLILGSGSYRIVFSDPAGIYAPAYLGDAGSFAASVPLLLAPAQTRDAIDAALVRAGRIAGRITDARSGAPLAGISVAAWNADGTARTIVRTDSAGNYVLVVPAGTYRIGAWDEMLRYATRFRFDSVSFDLGATLTVFAGDQLGGIDLALPGVTSARRRSVSH